jgi:DnaJ-class molecular chaperone
MDQLGGTSPERMKALRGSATESIFERSCRKCDGMGWYSAGGGPRERCPLCSGSGFTPTELGRQILLLIKHNSNRRR